MPRPKFAKGDCQTQITMLPFFLFFVTFAILLEFLAFGSWRVVTFDSDAKKGFVYFGSAGK
jgi:hypothetical protein